MHTSLQFAAKIRYTRRGFSAIEMLIAIALLMAVMGVAVKAMQEMQQRSASESSKTDTAQETRDFIDQIVRDIHGAGYPPARAQSWGAGIVPLCTNPTGVLNPQGFWNNPAVACGVISYNHNQIIYEGDLDGTGTVSTVTVDIVPAPGGGGTCPCILRRGLQTKLLALAGTPLQYFTEVNGVLNSGNGAGGSIFGVTLPGPGNYNAYNSADIFDAYDVNGNPVAPCTLTTNPDCTSIRSIQISANVAPTYNDLTTRLYPVFSVTSKARLNF
jgi:type II secretory pathway pseudopilin PulG